jgi:hypothetical protein
MNSRIPEVFVITIIRRLAVVGAQLQCSGNPAFTAQGLQS